MSYEASLKAKRDWENATITAERRGELKGLEKGRAEERAKAEAEKLELKLKLRSAIPLTL